MAPSSFTTSGTPADSSCLHLVLGRGTEVLCWSMPSMLIMRQRSGCWRASSALLVNRARFARAALLCSLRRAWIAGLQASDASDSFSFSVVHVSHLEKGWSLYSLTYKQDLGCG